MARDPQENIEGKSVEWREGFYTGWLQAYREVMEANARQLMMLLKYEGPEIYHGRR